MIGIELDKLAKGVSFFCCRCNAEFTIYSHAAFSIMAVDEEHFKQGYTCHCGQNFEIEY